MKKQIAIALAALLTAMACTGCRRGNVVDLTDQVEDNPVSSTQPSEQGDNPVSTIQYSEVSDLSVTEFSVRLFQNVTTDGNNTLISPLSVLAALSMTANGAHGETLTEMESVLGMSVSELNVWLHEYMTNLPSGEKYSLHLANSIWFKDGDNFAVNDDFLRTTVNYYGAGVYKAPFDSSTCREINRWVEENTNGMIKDILNQIPAEAVMYLVNALAFEAEWQEIYKENRIRDGVFTTEAGEEQTVELMYAEESYYLEDEGATGFLKHYSGGDYAFVALLPKEGVTVAEYVASLNGEHLSSLLAEAQRTTVFTAIPKFEAETDVEMSEVLTAMGMPMAFDSNLADFSRLGTSGDGNIYIDRVLHKTYIKVDEKGTKAGAATVVEMLPKSAEMITEPKKVILDRPFVYMLVDCRTNLPFFIGTLMDVQ